jgi:hypothetical protein
MSKANSAAVKGLSTKQIILILGIVAIVCATVVVAIILLKDKPGEMGVAILNESNAEQIQSDVKEKVAKGMFMTHMNTTWNFPNGKSPSSNAIMGNAPGNNYPFWFSLALSESKDIVFESGILAVGTQIKEIKLSKALEKGSYPAVVTIHMVDENGDEIENNMGFNISIEVEN